MEDILDRPETESDEFGTPSFPFLPGLAFKELRALHSEDCGLEASLESEGPSKTITTTKKTTGVRPYSASPFS